MSLSPPTSQPTAPLPCSPLADSQYLHRESILLANQVAELALDSGRSIILEKTLHSSDHVLAITRQLAGRGCHVHLFGTHITPRTNWEFLRNRMLSGQAFGRFITKEQTIASLRAYHEGFSSILADPAKRGAFESIHLYDVEANRWAISMGVGTSVSGEAAEAEAAEAEAAEAGAAGDAQKSARRRFGFFRRRRPDEKDDPIRRLGALKGLLDDGAITQDEYDAKKVSLLAQI